MKYVDAITGEVLDKEPKPMDFEISGTYLIRIVPELQLVEVRLDVPYSVFEILANLSSKWTGVERPADRIIFRYYKTKINAFFDAVPDSEADFVELEPRKRRYK